MKSATTHIRAGSNIHSGRVLLSVARVADPSVWPEPKKKSLVSTEQELIKRLEKDGTASGAAQPAAAAGWDEVEELAAARSHREVREKVDRRTELERLCEDPNVKREMQDRRLLGAGSPSV